MKRLILTCLIFLWKALAQELSFIEFHKAHLGSALSLKEASPRNLLLPFNETRIPGSEGSIRIQNFIKNYFQGNLSEEWTFEEDSFIEKGHSFTNLAFTAIPGDSYLVIGAHYDSKTQPPGFIGAMDSAASCAILLYLAKFIDHILEIDRDLLNPLLLDSRVGLKIVFFDGEEAFNQWGPDDSIYGSKHLAKRWNKHGILEKIDLFVLMDLIGGEEQLPVHSYHGSSHAHYTALSEIETLVTGIHNKWLDPSERKYVQLRDPFIDDDHRPFHEAGVPVLHLIPFPFPATWHTIDDDFDHLDEMCIRKWAVMMSQFVLDFLQG